MTTLSSFQKQHPAFAGNLKSIDRGYVSKNGKPSKCWEWQGAVFSNGYGRLTTPVVTKAERFLRTHRYSLFLKRGNKAIPPSMKALHRCDNRLCCNPKHIYMGDHAQNMKDMKERGRASKGTSHFRSVFTEDDVQVIRFLKDEASFTLSELVAMFGDSKSSLSKITSPSRNLWAHVKPISTEKELISLLKLLKKRGRIYPIPSISNQSAAQRNIKILSRETLAGLVDTFGQIKTAEMLTITRRQVRHWLENDGSIIYKDGDLSWTPSKDTATHYLTIVNKYAA